ncbi:HlyD family secretion protein [Actimicrobium sp. CCI2.3]|uniref:HlyD family secretion protein n=1 Tax=Actimicrobium sp. CCI2.3 TaxID=3048616 RepID=UPI002AB5BE90|nr:HlyD family secretion protein [Actimicrobium sp. CCI2.3]MDY7574200.1 HlyD family secretion protein [Actimicrobium sp. CCI2.3]MEB0023857.1 HlyD family secretion protein [Actimicrobium sp. CCI2.3]
MPFNITLPALGRFALTLATVAVALFAGWHLWQHYEVDPWTRDGRIKAGVVQVAPDVTGQITSVQVHDNQHVVIGQALFEIDRARFALALRQADAALQAQQILLTQAEKEARRNSGLGDLVAQEATEQGQSKVAQARAMLAQAAIARDMAQLNLTRTRVVSAVNGVATNLDLRAGTYVTAGHPVIALIDLDSFYAEGYFEENKLPGIHLGDPVGLTLMGERRVLGGHVDSFSGGIADRDRSTASNLLPNVNPTFNWVRLAQRIPVRIALDKVPDGVRLVAGQTVTIAVHPQPATVQ